MGLEVEETDVASLKYVRCMCCKELGHRIDNCLRDPNLRTGERDINLEFDRIRKIKDFRKLSVDTLVNTAHMFKKAVMLPLERDELGEICERENQMNPFSRGVLCFDDYNYDVFNQYVLLASPHDRTFEALVPLATKPILDVASVAAALSVKSKSSVLTVEKMY